MHRSTLISYQGVLLTPDTAHAVKALTIQAAANQWTVQVVGPVAGSQSGNPLSLVSAGREVHLRLERAGVADPQQILNATWGYAVPGGFTPWLRYPIAGQTEEAIFHYFGPWKYVYDRLIAEGRGHLAWPSVCAAAQCDVGAWAGDRVQERFLQAQLHRLGQNCGPVDGVLGSRTTESLEALGLVRLGLPQLLEYVSKANPAAPSAQSRQQGHVAMPGRQMTVNAFGGIKVVQTAHGATLTVDGPGRVVLDIGEST